VTRSFWAALLVVGVCLVAGVGLVGWRVVQGGKQKIGGTVIRRPSLKRTPPAANEKAKKGKAVAASRPNLAPLATVTVSSVQEGDQSSQGVADDQPDDRQWVSAGESSGAWIQLEWDEPVTVSEIELRDRPSLTENILAGTILFEDGGAVAVPSLPPDGSPWRTVFPPRTIRRLRFRIDSVSGGSTGLAGISVFPPLQQ
jgi:hypothetical protein